MNFANVRVVVWDLDGSFWLGTLDEAAVTPLPAHLALVRTLARRGIVSSICSRNDPALARRELEKLGVWDLFVFPAIS